MAAGVLEGVGEWLRFERIFGGGIEPVMGPLMGVVPAPGGWERPGGVWPMGGTPNPGGKGGAPRAALRGKGGAPGGSIPGGGKPGGTEKPGGGL